MYRSSRSTIAAVLVVLGAAAVAAQTGPYVNLGWNTSLIGESAYTPGRPEITLGWMRGEERSSIEIGTSWTYLEDDEYRTFWLDERYADAFAPRDVVTDRDDFRSRYHVLELGARASIPLPTHVLTALIGVEKTGILLGYDTGDGTTRWETRFDAPWAISYGFRFLLVYGFLEWRGTWELGGEDWEPWKSVHDHGISIGFSWNPFWGRSDE